MDKTNFSPTQSNLSPFEMEKQRDHKIISGFASLLSAAKTNLDIDLPSDSKELACLLSPSISDSEQCCVFPALALKEEERFKTSTHCGRKRMRNHKTRSIKEATAHALSIPFLCTRTSEKLKKASYIMIDNFSDSFKFLVRSRLVSCVKALLQQQNKVSNRLLLNMLTNPSIEPFELMTIVTSFHVIPIDDSNGRSRKMKRVESDQEGKSSEFECNSSREVILPLLFEVTIDLKLFGENEITVPLNAPGIIAGTFRRNESNDGLLQHVEVSFDTKILLDSMMQQARQVAKKTISLAADASRLLIAAIPSYSDSALSIQGTNSSCKQNQGLQSSSNSDSLLYAAVKQERRVGNLNERKESEPTQFVSKSMVEKRSLTTGDLGGNKKARVTYSCEDSKQVIISGDETAKNATWEQAELTSPKVIHESDGAESDAVDALALLYQSHS